MAEANKTQRNLLASPTYCLGSSFQPEEQAGQWVLTFDYTAGAEFWELPEEQQLARFKEFLGWLVEKRHLALEGGSLKVISPTYWLQVQKRLADELKQEGLPAELEEKLGVAQSFWTKK
ncbi:MAG: hypothetical protein HPY50_00005 [Firmicutes bacterium]|nr:hypothetical protein [Bacillota bacterium]